MSDTLTTSPHHHCILNCS